MQRTPKESNPNVMKNMSLWEKQNSELGKDTENWQSKTQRNCDALSICRQNVPKNDVYLTLLEKPKVT